MQEFLVQIEKSFDKANVDSIKTALDYAKNFTYQDSLYDYDMAKYMANSLLSLKMDANTVLASILYPAIKNGSSEAILAKIKNADVKKILSATLTLDEVKLSSRLEQESGIKDMFIALAKDVRVIILKLAIEEYKITHISKVNPDDRHSQYILTRDIYAPLSAMLGISHSKNIFEDNIFKYFKPDEYAKLEAETNKFRKDRDQALHKAIAHLDSIIRPQVPNMEIYGRQKQLYSIYKKIKDKNYDLSSIYDILAIRIIVDTVEECYKVLGLVHGIYQPIDHFKDYIASPKENGYQSLHTTVIIDSGDPLEIQIRTHEMHTYNEYGLAAHWAYKEKRSANTEHDNKINYIRSLLDMYKEKSSEELLSALQVDIYQGEIFVQSPKGKVVKLPEGSTPIDFAFAIHSKVGETCVGSIINGKMKPISTPLNNGDIVEIVTNPQAKGPSRDWLTIAKTASAKARINAYFRREMKDENIKRGKSILQAYAKDHNVKLNDLMQEEYLDKLFDRYAISSIDDMYASIGYNGLTAVQVISWLQKEDREKNPVITNVSNYVAPKQQGDVLFSGSSGFATKYAQCCKPIPGDKIVGYVTRGQGITIHRQDCPLIKHYEPERLMVCDWNAKSGDKFIGSIDCITINNPGVLATISKKISDMKYNIVGVAAKILPNDTSNISISIEVSSNNDIEECIARLRGLTSVIDAYRSK